MLSKNLVNLNGRMMWGSNSKPMVSVICLTYNHEKYIGAALNSFLMQRTSFPVEVIVGEDFSNDSTGHIVAEYCNKYPETFQIVRAGKNVGMNENFRNCLKHCSGEYIAICEGDDFWVDEFKLQKQVDFLENNPDYVLSFHDATIIFGGAIFEKHHLNQRLRQDASAWELKCGRGLSTLTVCFRNLLSDLPPESDHVPVLDIFLWSLLSNFGEAKYQENIKPAVYRRHEGGAISMKTRAEQCRMTMISMTLLAQYWQRMGEFEVARSILSRAVQLGIRQSRLRDLVRFQVVIVKELLLALMFKK